MARLVAALPMYDWPEMSAGVDAFWDRLRDHLRLRGIDAPERLSRRNADLPPVPGGIRDEHGHVIAPDPATLDPDGFDLSVVWRHPALVFAQTCWGPLETGLLAHVSVIGQPDYSGIEGGQGPCYRSALIIRADHPAAPPSDMPAPSEVGPLLPVDRLAGLRFAFNERMSRSGWRALAADLAEAGSGMGIFGATLETGGHRRSIRAVAEGRADCATIDSLSWAMAKVHEPAAGGVRVAGWTASRLGLPFIQSRSTKALTDAADAWNGAPLGLASEGTSK